MIDLKSVVEDPRWEELSDRQKETVVNRWYKKSVASDPRYTLLPSEKRATLEGRVGQYVSKMVPGFDFLGAGPSGNLMFETPSSKKIPVTEVAPAPDPAAEIPPEEAVAEGLRGQQFAPTPEAETGPESIPEQLARGIGASGSQFHRLFSDMGYYMGIPRAEEYRKFVGDRERAWMGEDPTRLTRVTSGAAQILPFIAAPSAAVPLFGSMAGFGTAAEAKELGKSFVGQTLSGAVSGVASAMLMKLPLRVFANPTTPLLKRMIEGAAVLPTFTVLQTAVDTGIRKAYLDPEMELGAIWPTLVQSLGDSAIVGLVSAVPSHMMHAPLPQALMAKRVEEFYRRTFGERGRPINALDIGITPAEAERIRTEPPSRAFTELDVERDLARLAGELPVDVRPEWHGEVPLTERGQALIEEMTYKYGRSEGGRAATAEEFYGPGEPEPIKKKTPPAPPKVAEPVKTVVTYAKETTPAEVKKTPVPAKAEPPVKWEVPPSEIEKAKAEGIAVLEKRHAELVERSRLADEVMALHKRLLAGEDVKAEFLAKYKEFETRTSAKPESEFPLTRRERAAVKEAEVPLKERKAAETVAKMKAEAKAQAKADEAAARKIQQEHVVKVEAGEKSPAPAPTLEATPALKKSSTVTTQAKVVTLLRRVGATPEQAAKRIAERHKGATVRSGIPVDIIEDVLDWTIIGAGKLVSLGTKNAGAIRDFWKQEMISQFGPHAKRYIDVLWSRSLELARQMEETGDQSVNWGLEKYKTLRSTFNMMREMKAELQEKEKNQRQMAILGVESAQLAGKYTPEQAARIKAGIRKGPLIEETFKLGSSREMFDDAEVNELFSRIAAYARENYPQQNAEGITWEQHQILRSQFQARLEQAFTKELLTGMGASPADAAHIDAALGVDPMYRTQVQRFGFLDWLRMTNNLFKNWKGGGDDSAALRQFFNVFFTHPDLWYSSFKSSIRSMLNPKYAQSIYDSLAKDLGMKSLLEEAGVEIDDPSKKIADSHDDFYNMTVLDALIQNAQGKYTKPILKGVNLVPKFVSDVATRAFSTFGNVARPEMLLREIERTPEGRETLRRLAIQRELDSATPGARAAFMNGMREMFFRDIKGLIEEASGEEMSHAAITRLGRATNVLTGRGDMKFTKNSVARAIMWAPRYFSAVCQQTFVPARYLARSGYAKLMEKAGVTPKDNFVDRTMRRNNEYDRMVASYVLRKWIALSATGAAMVAVINAAGGDADIEVNPLSTDFGKFRAGNIRFNIYGGELPLIRSLAQFFSGKRKTIRGGKITDVGYVGSLNVGHRAAVAIQFAHSKLSPLPSMAYSGAAGQFFGGKKITAGSTAEQLFMPMFLEDAYNAAEDGFNARSSLHPMARAVAQGVGVGTTSFFGAGTQTFDEPRSTGYDIKERPVKFASRWR